MIVPVEKAAVSCVFITRFRAGRSVDEEMASLEDWRIEKCWVKVIVAGVAVIGRPRKMMEMVKSRLLGLKAASAKVFVSLSTQIMRLALTLSYV